jgi:chloramphenicol O-acetyltransferase type A
MSMREDAGMEQPHPLDLATWPRAEHFAHYLRTVPCTYALTADVDVTPFVAALRAAGRKTYAAQIWAIATVVNRHPEFRMTLTDAGNPAVWPVSHPSFTVFNPERETFASVWTPYDPDFARFHDAVVALLVAHRTATSMFPQGDTPANSFDVSSVPWTSFTGFTLQIDGGSQHLAPIFTLGRYVERDGRTWMPLAVQIHHAAADGFHTARLVEELRELFRDPGWVGAG